MKEEKRMKRLLGLLMAVMVMMGGMASSGMPTFLCPPQMIQQTVYHREAA